MVSGRAGRVALLLSACILLLTIGCTGDDDGTASAGQSQHSDDLLRQGLDAHAAGHLDDAEDYYRQAIEADKDNSYAYYNLAVVLQTRERYVDSERNYRQALRVDPNFTSALFNLAILRVRSDALAEAVALYDRVTTLDDEFAPAHYNLGLLLVSLGQTDRAAQELGRAVELDPALVGKAVAAGASEQVAPPSTEPSGAA